MFRISFDMYKNVLFDALQASSKFRLPPPPTPQLKVETRCLPFVWSLLPCTWFLCSINPMQRNQESPPPSYALSKWLTHQHILNILSKFHRGRTNFAFKGVLMCFEQSAAARQAAFQGNLPKRGLFWIHFKRPRGKCSNWRVLVWKKQKNP
jgi:hypothetical protein